MRSDGVVRTGRTDPGRAPVAASARLPIARGGRTAKGAAPSGKPPPSPCVPAQAPATSTAARFFLPRRSTSHRPCSSSCPVTTASSAVTLTLFT